MGQLRLWEGKSVAQGQGLVKEPLVWRSGLTHWESLLPPGCGQGLARNGVLPREPPSGVVSTQSPADLPPETVSGREACSQAPGATGLLSVGGLGYLESARLKAKGMALPSAQSAQFRGDPQTTHRFDVL